MRPRRSNAETRVERCGAQHAGADEKLPAIGDGDVTHRLRSGGRPFFMSVISSPEGWGLQCCASIFRMFCKNFTRVNI
ncbi:hypothetical protein X772_33210 [Mesorhizobium sp. LSJC280B00]|nr:hypothetical protein X772_33210 [Mesorhizobium sp. LSJC280B00]